MCDKNNIIKKGISSGIVWSIWIEVNIIVYYSLFLFSDFRYYLIIPMIGIPILSLVLVNRKGTYIFLEVLLALFVMIVIWCFWIILRFTRVNDLLYEYQYVGKRRMTSGIALGRTLYAITCTTYYLPASFIAYFIARKKYKTKIQ